METITQYKVQCGNGGLALKRGNHSSQRSGGSVSGGASGASGGSLATQENVDKFLANNGNIFSGSPARLLSEFDGIPGASSVVKKAISEKNGSIDRGGGTVDRVNRVAEAYHGRFNGGTRDSGLRTNKNMATYMESVQTVLTRTKDTPMARAGAHAIGETYKRMSNSQKNRFAYQASKGFYKLSPELIGNIPQKSVVSDLAKRMKSADGAVSRSRERQLAKWG